MKHASVVLVICATMAAAVVQAGPAMAAPPPKPGVSTGGVEALTPTGATVKGSVNPKGYQTNAFVQYGPGGKLTATTPPVAVGAGRGGVPVKVALSGLAPVTKYSYRVVASSVNGRTNGAVRTFTTPKVPPSVTLAAAPAVVRFGSPVTLSGTVGGTGAGGSRVVAEGRPFPFSTPFTLLFPNQLVANAAGLFTFTHVPGHTGQYRVRATVGGKQVASPVVTVGVAPAVELRARRVKGGKVKFTGIIRPGGEAVVSLRRIGSRGQRTTVSKTTVRGSSPGTFRFRSRSVRRTATYVALVQPTGGAYVRVESNTKRVRR